MYKTGLTTELMLTEYVTSIAKSLEMVWSLNRLARISINIGIQIDAKANTMASIIFVIFASFSRMRASPHFASCVGACLLLLSLISWFVCGFWVGCGLCHCFCGKGCVLSDSLTEEFSSFPSCVKFPFWS